MTDTEPLVLTPEQEALFAPRGARLRQAAGKTVEGTVEMGKALIDDKAALDHGLWLPYLRWLPLGDRQADHLMSIARHPVLSNSSHGTNLPIAWTTLARLATLPDEVVEAAIASGEINPSMTRADADALVAKHKAPSRRAGAPVNPQHAAANAADQPYAAADLIDKLVQLSADCTPEDLISPALPDPEQLRALSQWLMELADGHQEYLDDTAEEVAEDEAAVDRFLAQGETGQRLAH